MPPALAIELDDGAFTRACAVHRLLHPPQQMADILPVSVPNPTHAVVLEAQVVRRGVRVMQIETIAHQVRNNQSSLYTHTSIPSLSLSLAAASPPSLIPPGLSLRIYLPINHPIPPRSNLSQLRPSSRVSAPPRSSFSLSLSPSGPVSLCRLACEAVVTHGTYSIGGTRRRQRLRIQANKPKLKYILLLLATSCMIFFISCSPRQPRGLRLLPVNIRAIADFLPSNVQPNSS